MGIYLDHNSTAPLMPEVLDAMLPFLNEQHGNPASRHAHGRKVLDAVELARVQVAKSVNANPSNVIFTASGTESNNHIIKGVATKSDKKNIVTSGIEHPCVHCAARAMARRGHNFFPIGVDKQGVLDFDDLQTTLEGNKTSIVSVMLANNETGVIQDVAKVTEFAHNEKAIMHTDAAQALGKIPIDYEKLGVDSMTLSSHKAGGPMGVAALIKNNDVDCEPLLEGGGQEDGERSGTLNVPGIVGFGKAAELAHQRSQFFMNELTSMRDSLEEQLADCNAVIFSQNVDRLPNTSYFGIPGIEGESLVVMLDQAGFDVASGSACASTKNEPSHVLLAMGYSEQQARTAVRVSLGLGNTQKQIDDFATAVVAIAQRLSSMASSL